MMNLSAVFEASMVPGSADAPAGAMQFLRENPKDLAVFWVGQRRPKVNIDRDCPCRGVYPVLVNMLPEPWRSRVQRSIFLSKRVPVVCDCVGQVIE